VTPGIGTELTVVATEILRRKDGSEVQTGVYLSPKEESWRVHLLKLKEPQLLKEADVRLTTPLEDELNFRTSQYEKLAEASRIFCPTERSPQGCNWKSENFSIYQELCRLRYTLAGIIGALRKQLSQGR
jgi:hypothetical protein